MFELYNVAKEMKWISDWDLGPFCNRDWGSHIISFEFFARLFTGTICSKDINVQLGSQLW